MNTSTTPRTDAETCIWSGRKIFVNKSLALKLEMELAVSLENQVKAQAEIARLRDLLNQAMSVAKEYQKHACKNINEDCDWSMQDTHKRFDAIKSVTSTDTPHTDAMPSLKEKVCTISINPTIQK